MKFSLKPLRAITTTINSAAMAFLAYVFARTMLFGSFVVFEPNPLILAFEFFVVVMTLPLNLLLWWEDA